MENRVANRNFWMMTPVHRNFFAAMKHFGLRATVRRLVKGHWSIYTDRIGTSLSEATTETEMTGSPYSPLVGGRLIEIYATIGGSAATALWNGGYIVLKSVSFGGVNVYLPFQGPGIKTAPAFGGSHSIVSQKCDLAVREGVKIQAYVKHETADTPITFEAQLFGVFTG